MDGLSVFASYNPQESAVNETETGFGATALIIPDQDLFVSAC